MQEQQRKHAFSSRRTRYEKIVDCRYYSGKLIQLYFKYSILHQIKNKMVDNGQKYTNNPKIIGFRKK